MGRHTVFREDGAVEVDRLIRRVKRHRNILEKKQSPSLAGPVRSLPEGEVELILPGWRGLFA